MKTYQADGFTFTEEQLSHPNPYTNPDGTVKQGCEFAFFAFVAAKSRYEDESVSPDERERREEMRRHMADKMSMPL